MDRETPKLSAESTAEVDRFGDLCGSSVFVSIPRSSVLLVVVGPLAVVVVGDRGPMVV